MKKIGIIGGMGPESTVDYYRLIIDSYRKIRKRKGAPVIVIYSLDFDEVHRMMENQSWDKLTKILINSVESLYNAGADIALIASNTPHIVFNEVSSLSPIPMLSIVEETCKVVRSKGIKRVGLLGTKITMQSQYYQNVFDRYNITIVVPAENEQRYIQEKLSKELFFGRIVEKTRIGFLSIVKKMVDRDFIQGLILGCTEIPLILTKDEFGIPFLNTTHIHAESALAYCLSQP